MPYSTSEVLQYIAPMLILIYYLLLGITRQPDRYNQMETLHRVE